MTTISLFSRSSYLWFLTTRDAPYFFEPPIVGFFLFYSLHQLFFAGFGCSPITAPPIRTNHYFAVPQRLLVQRWVPVTVPLSPRRPVFSFLCGCCPPFRRFPPSPSTNLVITNHTDSHPRTPFVLPCAPPLPAPDRSTRASVNPSRGVFFPPLFGLSLCLTSRVLHLNVSLFSQRRNFNLPCPSAIAWQETPIRKCSCFFHQ